jgi:hypothetical protein
MPKSALFLALALTPLGLAGRAASAQASRPVAEATWFWDGEAWAPHSRTLWSYDRPDGEATLALAQVRDDEQWVDASRETWTLDGDGRQLQGVTAEWSDGAWVEQTDMAFAYDAAGHKVAARRRAVEQNGAAVNADSLASTFVDGLETERRFFRWQDGAWSEVLRQTSAYHADGRERTRTHTAPAPDGWEDRRRWTFAYDGDRLTESLVEQVEDGTWTPWLDQTYAYDAEGRLIEVVHEEWDGERWVPMMRVETRYAAAP